MLIVTLLKNTPMPEDSIYLAQAGLTPKKLFRVNTEGEVTHSARVVGTPGSPSSLKLHHLGVVVVLLLSFLHARESLNFYFPPSCSLFASDAATGIPCCVPSPPAPQLWPQHSPWQRAKRTGHMGEIGCEWCEASHGEHQQKWQDLRWI